MEFRPNQNLESRPQSIGQKPFTARERGVKHPYERVRALFSNHASHSLRIGRTWMLPSHPQICATNRDGLNVTEHIDTERSFNSYHSTRTSNGDQRQPRSVQCHLSRGWWNIPNQKAKSPFGLIKYDVFSSVARGSSSNTPMFLGQGT